MFIQKRTNTRARAHLPYDNSIDNTGKHGREEGKEENKTTTNLIGLQAQEERSDDVWYDGHVLFVHAPSRCRFTDPVFNVLLTNNRGGVKIGRGVED